MNQNEINRMDAELEKITSENQKRSRAAEQRASTNPKMPTWTEVGRRMHRRAQIRRVANALARLLPGVVFLAAIPKGWMHPPFACLMFLASFTWSMGYFMRGYRYE